MFIKGLATLEDFENKKLQNMRVATVEGVLSLNENILEIFEVEVGVRENSIKEISFSDMNLSILDLAIEFNIIGIKEDNEGLFFRSKSNKLIEFKHFLSVKKAYISIVEATFRLEEKRKIYYNIMLIIDILKDENINESKNPYNEIKSKRINEWELLFDKEFI